MPEDVKIFISYNSEDVEPARDIAEMLRARGAEVFLAEDSIRPGEIWVDKIEQALGEADFVISLVTPSTQHSQAWAAETGFTLARKIPIIPVAIGEVDQSLLPRRLRELRHVSWRSGAEAEALDQIARATLGEAA